MNFEQYLGRLGGEQVTQYAKRPFVDNGYMGGGYWTDADRPNTAFGSAVSPRTIAPSQSRQYQGFEGYRDLEGNFLGYGSDPNSLYNNSPDLQRQYTEYVANEPSRQAQQLENQRLQAEYARLQQEALTQERQQDLPTLATFNPTPQQFSGGLMGQQPMQQQPMQQQPMQQQPMQQQPMQQQGGGLINYTHRGNMGGMGGTGGTTGGLTRGGGQ